MCGMVLKKSVLDLVPLRNMLAQNTEIIKLIPDEVLSDFCG